MLGKLRKRIRLKVSHIYLEPPQDSGLTLSIDWEKIKGFGKQYFSMTEEELMMKVVEDKGIQLALEIIQCKDQAEGRG